MPYWVFGYGSLIWKPPPHAVEQRNGYVKGVVRRFAQSSIDHRGVPEAPGRVVTVINANEWHKLAGVEPGEGEDYVCGIAYRIDSEKEDEVRAYLEHREKVGVSLLTYRGVGEDELIKAGQNGYTCHHVHVYGHVKGEEKTIVEDCTIWIGRLDNPAFVGYEPLDQLAETIYHRIGPSGPNKDYVYKLAESVRELYPDVKDDYLFELEAAVKKHETA